MSCLSSVSSVTSVVKMLSNSNCTKEDTEDTEDTGNSILTGSLLHDFPYRRIRDAELLEVRAVLLGIVVVLPHLRPVLRHRLLVQPDRRLVGGGEKGAVLHGLRLHVVEVAPRVGDDLRLHEDV